MELYEKDGKIGILVSPGYGAGWSTWNTKELAYDKRVVEFWLSHKDDAVFMANVERTASFDFWGNVTPASDANKEAEAFFKSIGYEKCPYMGGFADIKLQFVRKGIPWMISEYDGYEELIEVGENNPLFTTFM